MTTVHPYSGVGMGHTVEDGFKGSHERHLSFWWTGPEPQRKACVGAVLNGQSGDAGGPGGRDSDGGRSPARSLGVQPLPHANPYSRTASRALNCFVFRETDRCVWGTSTTGPGGAQPDPDSITVSTVERTLVTVPFATDELKTIFCHPAGDIPKFLLLGLLYPHAGLSYL